MSFDYFRNPKVKLDKEVFELVRFCNVKNTQVVGGASKLFKSFLKEGLKVKKIISFADLRWSKGDLYEKLGFGLEKIADPSFFYLKPGPRQYSKRYYRSNFTKTKEDIKDLTEWENRILQGFDRIWDCGKQRWVKVF